MALRLISIKLAGFKSFVDPTKVTFPGNIAAIVGPNGCGKSNIIDAVRWVMGESSAKQLRGESMADVIFNGTTGRKPVGKASIELTFDNSDASIGGEYAQYSTIALRREVTRDGASNYFLNNTRCRRKDITDIFLGTGLGPRSYSIIEQGTISRLIEAKPEELRNFLEEAAGISKYKERRRETENRISHTRENLERLGDLRQELGRQLERLERQAKAAEKYQLLKQEERLFRAQLQVLRYRGLNTDAASLEQRIKQQDVFLSGKAAEQQHIATELEKNRLSQIQATDTFNETQSRYYALGAEIVKLEQGLRHSRENEQRIQQELRQLEQSMTEEQTQLKRDRETLAALAAEMNALAPNESKTQTAQQQSREAFQQMENVVRQGQKEWEAFNQQAHEHEKRLHAEKTQIQHLEQRLQWLSTQESRLVEQQSTLLPEPIQQEMAQLQGSLKTAEEKQQTQTDHMADIQKRIAHQRELIVDHDISVDEARANLQKMKGQLASAEAMQSEVLNKKKDNKVQAWMQENRLEKAKRLGQSIKVQEGFESAVEMVLADNLDAIYVENVLDYVNSLKQLSKAHLTLVEVKQTSVASANFPLKTLASYVTTDAPISASLQGVYCADSLEQALSLVSQLKPNESIVTQEGLWLGSGWVKLARGADNEMGVIKRQQHIETLQKNIETAQQSLSILEKKLQTVREQLVELEQLRDDENDVLQAIRTEIAQIRAEVKVKQNRLDHILSQSTRVQKELGDIQRQAQEIKASLDKARSAASLAEKEIAGDQVTRQTLLAARDHNQEQLNKARAAAEQDQQTYHQLSLKLQALRSQQESLRQAILRLEKQGEQLQSRDSELKAQLAQAKTPQASLETQLNQLLNDRNRLEQEVAKTRDAVEMLDEQTRTFEKTRQQIEEVINKERQALENSRMQWQTHVVRRDACLEQLQQIGFTLESASNDLPENANTAEWEEKTNSVSSRIERLGAINLAAIEEFKAESERKTYLDAQTTDLEQALTTLESAIQKIDRETKARFKETYDKVNSEFQRLFQRIFGGGDAYLQMEGDDLLSTGVTVIAKPPGKRTSTIHLLSGGEKALTAISLVFSIFQLNPSPFCMLDEVDAPLDDSNVGRFCNLVREMSSRVQMIYISHNKVAMEMAEHLIGVTMHEPGVSRLVAVNMEEALALAEV